MKTKKQTIKQKIVATTVVLFMMCMMFGSLNLPGATAAGTNTTLVQNIVAGAGALGHSAAASLGFTPITVGTASNTTGTLPQTNVWDFRGTGVGWTLSGIANNLAIATAGLNNISSANIMWNPAGGTFTALSGATTGMTLGTAANLDASRTMLTAPATYGMGNYRVWNTAMTVYYNGDMAQLVGTYQAFLTLTSA
jgi:hypothetical protein